ncbi:potassium channel family protein [Haloferax namakaokahaiae]|uniref:Potassium channel family protein n=1 Tax=Haloferax namakaokahaiae TaxID=1748331 RepID=A0ABD5ZI26_9EURY
MNPVSGLLAAFRRRSLLRSLLRPLLAFAFVVVAGVVGFTTLGGVGVIDALFWLLDPTSIELYFQEHAGPATVVKAYAIVVLSGLVVAGLWTGETVFSAVFGGRLSTEVTRMHMNQQINDQTDHVVICGYGTFGKTIAARLRESDTSVVVVERGDVQYDRAIEDGHLVVQGDARYEEPLEEARIKQAATIIAAIDDTNANVKIAVTATQLAPTVRVVVRAGDLMDEAVARRVGADEVIVPEVVSAERVVSKL